MGAFARVFAHSLVRKPRLSGVKKNGGPAVDHGGNWNGLHDLFETAAEWGHDVLLHRIFHFRLCAGALARRPTVRESQSERHARRALFGEAPRDFGDFHKSSGLRSGQEIFRHCEIDLFDISGDCYSGVLRHALFLVVVHQSRGGVWPYGRPRDRSVDRFLEQFTMFQTIISQPWSIYFQFVIEERHGFNKMSAMLYVTDFLKSTVLTWVISAPILAAIIWVVKSTGERFYIYMWLVMAGIQILMLTLYPILIAPLFNKFEPLPEGQLRTKIEALAGKLSFPLTKLYVIDGSTRSAHSNAYMYGFWWNKRIVLYDTLLSQTTSDEDVVAVLGHELGHWKLNHTSFNLLITQVLLFSNFYLYGMVMNSDAMYASFGFADHGKPVVIGLFLFSMLLSPFDHCIGFAMNYLSRKFEYEADAFAKDLGYCDNLCSGLVSLQVSNLGDMNPDPLYSAYHNSHPTLLGRLRALRPSGKKKQ